MDLTRMADIAGIRIIISNLKAQDQIISIIEKKFKLQKKYDYRNKDQTYKSVHLILKDDDYKLIEIQIRTIAQHTWADESETFGEKAKQGIYEKEVEEYLRLLSTVTSKIDKDEKLENLKPENKMYQNKSQ